MISLIRETIAKIPTVTRAILAMTLLTTIAVELGVATPLKLYLNPKLVLLKGEWWRLLTCFTFLGRLSFSSCMNFISAYGTFSIVESGPFNGRTADFVYMLLFGWLTTCICGMALRLPYLDMALTTMSIYVLGKRWPSSNVIVHGTLAIPINYFPLLLLLFEDQVVQDVIGIFVGHLYFYFTDVCPMVFGGTRPLETPRFIESIFGRSNEYYGSEVVGSEAAYDDDGDSDFVEGAESEDDEEEGWCDSCDWSATEDDFANLKDGLNVGEEEEDKDIDHKGVTCTCQTTFG